MAPCGLKKYSVKHIMSGFIVYEHVKFTLLGKIKLNMLQV